MKIKILASMLAGALAMLPVTANAGWGGGGVGPYGDPITIYGWPVSYTHLRAHETS